MTALTISAWKALGLTDACVGWMMVLDSMPSGRNTSKLGVTVSPSSFTEHLTDWLLDVSAILGGRGRPSSVSRLHTRDRVGMDGMCLASAPLQPPPAPMRPNRFAAIAALSVDMGLING